MLKVNALTTVQRIEEELGLSEDKRSFIEDAINTASSIIETFCNRKFALRGHLDIIPEEEIEHVCEQFPLRRVISLNSKEMVDPFFTESGVIYESFPARSRLLYEAGYVTPSMALDDLLCDLPPDLEQACIDLVKYVYTDDEDASEREMAATALTLKSFELGDMKAALATSGGARDYIPADVQSLLRPYIKRALG